jgi:hypothetical protein
VVECGGLENRYVGNPGVGGSNPPLSAEARRVAACRTLRPFGPPLVSTPACAGSSARIGLAASLVSNAPYGRFQPSKLRPHPSAPKSPLLREWVTEPTVSA